MNHTQLDCPSLIPPLPNTSCLPVNTIAEAQDLASSLLLNKSLEELDVSGSKLDAGGIRCIVDAVKV